MSMRLRPDDIPVSPADFEANFTIAGKWAGHRVRPIDNELPIYVRERPQNGLPDIVRTYMYKMALENKSRSNKTARAILELLNIYDRPYTYNRSTEEAKLIYQILDKYTLVVVGDPLDEMSKYIFVRFEIPKDVSKKLIKWRYKVSEKEPTLIQKLIQQSIYELKGKINAINSLNRIKTSAKREEKQKSEEVCNQIDNLFK